MLRSFLLDPFLIREIPRELHQAARGNEVHVNIEDHRQEEFVKPALKVAAFSGKGQMLGRCVCIEEYV